MTLDELKKIVFKFRDERKWKNFHNPKDLAVGLTVEAGEVLEHFQWKNGRDLENYLKKNKEAVGEEIADVLHYIILLADRLNIDLESAFIDKVKKNEKKYPVKKVKGKNKKYTEYQNF